MNNYDIGNLSRLTGTFTNISGALTDPTTVTLRIKDPNGSVTVFSGSDITHESTGIYHYDLLLTVQGIWYFRYEGTGALVATGDSQLNVTGSVVLG